MMKKRILVITLILSLCIPASMAFADDSKKVDTNSQVYQEIGQINIDGMDLSVDNNTGDIVINQTDSSNAVANEKKDLMKHLYKNDELKGIIKTILNKPGHNLKAIGYTTVYCKEVTDANGTYLEPLTNAEITPQVTDAISSSATGDTTSYYLLTLYTAANLTVRNGVKYVDAYSCAHWSNGVSGAIGAPSANAQSYLSISLPSQYLLTGSTLTGGYNGVKTNEAYSSVVYGFRETDDTFTGPDITVAGYGQCTGTLSSKKFVSRYVHSYGICTIGISILPTGVSFTTSGTSWQIASSVIISC